MAGVAASKLADCGEPVEERIGVLSDQLFGTHHQRKDAIGAMVNALLTSIEVAPTIQNGVDSFEDPLLQWNAYLEPMEQVLEVLKQFVSQYVVHKPDIRYGSCGRSCDGAIRSLCADPDTAGKYLRALASVQ